jgi:hypothetical protein
MGKKNSEINLIKNPQNQDPTFVSDPLKELMLRYSNHQENNNITNNYDSNEKMVKKARHSSNKFSKSELRNNQSKEYPSKIIHLSTNRYE